MPNQHNSQARPGQHRLRALQGAVAQSSGRTMPYSDGEVADALVLIAQVGRAEASRRLGIPESTLAYFQDKQRRDLRAARAAYLQAGGELAEGEEPPDWRTQRELEANRAGLDATIVRDRATQAMLDGNWQLVKAGASYYSALIGSAQVLTAGQRPAARTPQERAEQEQRILANWQRRLQATGDTQGAEAVGALADGLRNSDGETDAAS